VSSSSSIAAAPSGASFAHTGRATFASGAMLVAGARDEIIAALERRARVIASPSMGRVGTLERARLALPVVELHAAIGALSTSLVARPRSSSGAGGAVGSSPSSGAPGAEARRV